MLKANCMKCGSTNTRSERSDDYNKKYRYGVQLGVFHSYNKAMDFQLVLIERGCISDIERSGEFYTVIIGDFSQLDLAVVLERYLRAAGFNTMVVAI